MKKRHKENQIVIKLREIDILLGNGKTVGEACRKFEITEQRYYRWQRKFRRAGRLGLNDITSRKGRCVESVAGVRAAGRYVKGNGAPGALLSGIGV